MKTTTLSTTLQRGLDRYSIGEKMRALRLRKKMRLVELAKHSGLSAALLSKLESGKLYPTLPTLLRVALVFGVGLEFFFAEDQRRRSIAVVRKAERLGFPERMGGRETVYRFESLTFNAAEPRVLAYEAEFLDAKGGRTHQHAGVEFIYVTEGKLEVTILGEPFLLKAGDTLYLNSEMPHGYRKIGRRSRAIVVTTAAS